MTDETIQNQFLVSLIITIYNVDAYLVKCLDSILNQTYKNLEVILIDDGSTDNSLKICNSYAKDNSTFIVIHQDNAGLYAARNKGLSLCHGTFIGFADADDWLDSDYVETLVAAIGNEDMVVWGFHVVESDGTIIEKHVPTAMKCTVMEYLGKTVNDELHIFNGCQHYPILGGYLWNKLFRRDVWGKLLFEEGKYFADTTAVMQYLGKSQRVQLIPSCHYYYFQREGSITHGRYNKNSVNFVEMRIKQKAFIISQQSPALLISRADMLILFAYVGIIRSCLRAEVKKSDILSRYWQGFHNILQKNFIVYNMQVFQFQ